MVRHLIYIYKVPKSSKRIGYVFSSNTPIYHKDLPETLLDIIGRYELSIHRITTDEHSIESIIDKDPFFDKIEFYLDIESFSNELEELVRKESVSPVEFSKLILSKFKLDKLQIQKVLYFIYSECLSSGIKLFTESPVAYRYGPVFEDVLQEYKAQPKGKVIQSDISYEKLISLPKTVYTPEVRKITERVMNAVEKERSGSLIDITHTSGGPWDVTYEEGCNNVITDNIILACNDKVLAELYG